ncbi:MAG TPA: S49 family peptidase, partial [Aestuariivirgaceae bacterium]|nr:S49 family peptidase [Aestuariivirgaceae bacterium]
SLVAERRQIPIGQVRLLADGRVYTGRQALRVKLVDAIGGEDAATSWLVTAKQIPLGTQIIDWKAEESFGSAGLGFAAVHSLLEVLGFERLAQAFERTAEGRGMRLDGLLAVWHPDAQ